MKKLSVLMIVGLCGVLAPAVALAGEGTGACIIAEPIDRSVY